jgi:hypothetical protein
MKFAVVRMMIIPGCSDSASVPASDVMWSAVDVRFLVLQFACHFKAIIGDGSSFLLALLPVIIKLHIASEY